MTGRSDALRRRPSFSAAFTPKLATVLREGYGQNEFRADAAAGLTVAIVALPLSMAIAIASGATPAMGLITAIVGGFLVSALGGSRLQIGGPAGAFIVLVAGTVQQHGIDGLILATMMSGFILLAAGFLRLGTYVKFIPYPVTIGFTAGIAAIIFISQLSALLGLTLDGPEPGPVLEKAEAIWSALPSASPFAAELALATILAILVMRRLRPRWPGMLIAVAGAAAAAALLGLPVETIDSRFGGVPRLPPAPSLPELSWEKIAAVAPNAVSFALLGAVESLLSAVVADGMSGNKHRSNCELVGQGAANIGSALFGGFCVTGTIARTATNVRAGAHGPVAGMLHAAFLLLFMIVAAPLAGYLPLAALAGVLTVVAFDMVERHAIGAILRSSRGESLVMIATFLLTVFRDLTEAIVVGSAIGSVLFIHRMSEMAAVRDQTARLAPADEQDDLDAAPKAGGADAEGIVELKVTGALFFGASSIFDPVLDLYKSAQRGLILDLSEVPFLDASGAHSIEGLVRRAERRGVVVAISGATRPMQIELLRHGLTPRRSPFAENPEQAREALAALMRGERWRPPPRRPRIDLQDLV